MPVTEAVGGVVSEEDPKRCWKPEAAVVGLASANRPRLSPALVGDAVVLVCSLLEESVVSSSEEESVVVASGD